MSFLIKVGLLLLNVAFYQNLLSLGILFIEGLCSIHQFVFEDFILLEHLLLILIFFWVHQFYSFSRLRWWLLPKCQLQLIELEDKQLFFHFQCLHFLFTHMLPASQYLLWTFYQNQDLSIQLGIGLDSKFIKVHKLYYHKEEQDQFWVLSVSHLMWCMFLLLLIPD